jgi:hypothetical protein
MNSTIALARSAMERIPLHSWEMEFSIQYHMTITANIKRSEFNKVLYNIVYSIVWYGMVWYGMVWYGMVWYSIV